MEGTFSKGRRVIPNYRMSQLHKRLQIKCWSMRECLYLNKADSKLNIYSGFIETSRRIHCLPNMLQQNLTKMKVLDTKSEFDTAIKSGVSVVDFYADWFKCLIGADLARQSLPVTRNSQKSLKDSQDTPVYISTK